MPMETHKRSIVKSITWRVIATLIAAYWVGFEIAILMNIVQTIAYYIHERLWVHINWGRQTNN
jgi:uncharacterized membrane protein